MRSGSFSFFVLLFSITTLFANAHEPQNGVLDSFERDEADDSGRSMMFGESNSKRGHADFRSGFGFNTNPHLLKNADVEDSGSFVLDFRPSACFFGGKENFHISGGIATNAGLLFGSSQATRFVLFNSLAKARGLLAFDKFVSLHMDGTIRSNREVKRLFVGSLTELKSDFDFGLKFRPGNGVITLVTQGEVGSETFLDFNQPAVGKYPGNINALDAQKYYFFGKLAWEFKENEELFLNTRFGKWIGAGESQLTTTSPLWINGGVSGLIGPNVRGSISAGYANSGIRLKASDTLLDGASLSFSMLSDLRWKISEGSELFLKLERELSPSSVFLETFTTSLHIDYRQKFLDDFTLVLIPSLQFFEYGKPLAPDNLGRLAGNHRNDVTLQTSEELMYFFRSWLSVGLSHRSNFRWSNASDLYFNTPEGKLADISGNLVSDMAQHEILLFTHLMY